MTSAWQRQLSEAITSTQVLCQRLNIRLPDHYTQSEALFPLRVPERFVERMEPGNPNDPLLRQVLAVSAEQQQVSGYSSDPLNEKQYNVLPGLIHKYKSRVLLTLSGGCAVHCRYCFRRHFPYQDNRIGDAQLNAILRYIDNDPAIMEVIFSGGDPLLLQDHRLKTIIEQIAAIKHVDFLRIHTRLPVVIPERITTPLINALLGTRLISTVVIHCNHPNEIDAHLKNQLLSLKKQGIYLLNQSVLLKGVNDHIHTLAALSHKLYQAGALPYYLHQLDPVSGTAHFAVTDQAACLLHQQLQKTLPGFLVPKLSREIAGAAHKTLLS